MPFFVGGDHESQFLPFSSFCPKAHLITGSNLAMLNATIQPSVKPLENGDRLNRVEFERRYKLLPPHKKAELINGVVYMAAALRYKSHGLPYSSLMG